MKSRQSQGPFSAGHTSLPRYRSELAPLMKGGGDRGCLLRLARACGRWRTDRHHQHVEPVHHDPAAAGVDQPGRRRARGHPDHAARRPVPLYQSLPRRTGNRLRQPCRSERRGPDHRDSPPADRRQHRHGLHQCARPVCSERDISAHTRPTRSFRRAPSPCRYL